MVARDCRVGFKTILVTLDESYEPQKSTNYNRRMEVDLMHYVFNNIKLLRQRKICVSKYHS
jgi:hypothetical protein